MRAELERRIAELSLEIRSYPTPIARCDEQLAGLLEERARARELLEKLNEESSCRPDAVWANDGGLDAA
jgi:hypothetical protein